MEYKKRLLEKELAHHLQRKKSILILGPRQTGKTTLLKQYHADFTLSFLSPKTRQRYERDPDLLFGEIKQRKEEKNAPKNLLVILDEIQKVPALLDVVQELIDQKIAQFILSGSSARKLKRTSNLNLLPGRVVTLHLDPFTYQENQVPDLSQNLYFGSLPGICATQKNSDKEIDLQSYVETYLEEEIRQEALVKNVGFFSRFLEFACIESGKIQNFRKLSQELGISHTTISSYYEILEDCLITERIDPFTFSTTRKKLTKSSRYLIFDLGVRRVCAREGTPLNSHQLGEIFEQYVGLELLRNARMISKSIQLQYWRDPGGPEIDWLLNNNNKLIPIEVKWSESPTLSDAKHLMTFLKEYPHRSKKAFIICRSPRSYKLNPNITVLPWQRIKEVVEQSGG